jgi:hypothetical protein
MAEKRWHLRSRWKASKDAEAAKAALDAQSWWNENWRTFAPLKHSGKSDAALALLADRDSGMECGCRTASHSQNHRRVPMASCSSPVHACETSAPHRNFRFA